MQIYIVTMKAGTDTFREMVFASDYNEARDIAEMRFDARCIYVRRAGR